MDKTIPIGRIYFKLLDAIRNTRQIVFDNFGGASPDNQSHPADNTYSPPFCRSRLPFL